MSRSKRTGSSLTASRRPDRGPRAWLRRWSYDRPWRWLIIGILAWLFLALLLAWQTAGLLDRRGAHRSPATGCARSLAS